MIDRRLEQLREEGVLVPDRRPRRRRSRRRRSCARASTRCCSAPAPRRRATRRCPGRELAGVHFAMDFLAQQNRRVAGRRRRRRARRSSRPGKHVVILGGGDTGSDCVGTSHRQGARSVTSIELLPRPPEGRARVGALAAWPSSTTSASSSSHDEGGARELRDDDEAALRRGRARVERSTPCASSSSATRSTGRS